MVSWADAIVKSAVAAWNHFKKAVGRAIDKVVEIAKVVVEVANTAGNCLVRPNLRCAEEAGRKWVDEITNGLMSPARSLLQNIKGVIKKTKDAAVIFLKIVYLSKREFTCLQGERRKHGVGSREDRGHAGARTSI